MFRTTLFSLLSVNWVTRTGPCQRFFFFFFWSTSLWIGCLGSFHSSVVPWARLSTSCCQQRDLYKSWHINDAMLWSESTKYETEIRTPSVLTSRCWTYMDNRKLLDTLFQTIRTITIHNHHNNHSWKCTSHCRMFDSATVNLCMNRWDWQYLQFVLRWMYPQEQGSGLRWHVTRMMRKEGNGDRVRHDLALRGQNINICSHPQCDCVWTTLLEGRRRSQGRTR